MLSLHFDPKHGVWADDPETSDKLLKNCFGSSHEGKVFLDAEEALYLVSFQNAVCTDAEGKSIGFNALASHFSKTDDRLLIKYSSYRDWRDRGLIVRRSAGYRGVRKEHIERRYPSHAFRMARPEAAAVWYPDSFFSVVEDRELGRKLFSEHWIGQLGVYKQERGDLLVLDFMESVFLAKHAKMIFVDAVTGKPITAAAMLKHAAKEREYAEQLYEVYEDWRLRGYVVKSGFKFGTHFRIYFPGASPSRGDDDWVHSKHVLHVFPKEQKLLVSEWARAVRVAHGVKKTFILCVPEMKKSDFVDYPASFIAYRRKKVGKDWVREGIDDRPRYLVAEVSEDEHIGGVELASLLEKAKSLGLELLLSINDRETSVTYYVLKQVQLPDSEYEYYEIEWMRP
jgi:tRNA-intron endonuclease